MQIDVESEIGDLQAVLVHRPGDEIVRMTQHDLDRMLFDDILAKTEAIREHDLLTGIMQAAGARVHQLSDMLQAALAIAPSEAVRALVEQCCRLAGASGLAELLASWSPSRLGQALVAGVYWSETEEAPRSLARIRGELPQGDPMALRPLPNMMFLRDPCISTYDRVVVGRMANASRARETLLVAFALTHTKNGAVQLSFAKPEGAGEAFGSVEGGDVLVLSPKLMMIGCSERTHPQTLERLATHGLFPDHPRLERIYAVMMPQARSVMHLDTILTQIDRQLVLGHAPLIEGAPGRPPLAVARLERNEPPVLVSSASVLDVLREELGADLGFVACGGDDPLHQEREQWTDGANAVALAPGQIILYARNTKTIDALADHDFTEVRLSLVQPAEQRATAVREAMKAGRTVFTFSGSELSRARGGGRCLTMPLVRAHLHDDDT